MAQQVAFTQQFGEIELHPLMHARHREHPEIFEITNRIVDGKRSETANIARRWHTDGAFTLSPTLATFLHGRACPSWAAPLGSQMLTWPMTHSPRE